MSSGKTIIKAIAYVLVAVVIVGVIGIIFRYTNGFNEDFKTFYIEYNGEKILSEHTTKELTQGAEHRFDVKYIFDGDEQKTKDYSVSIAPNATKDFEFEANGKRYLYSKVSELEKAFTIERKETSFCIRIPDDGLTLKQALDKVFDTDVSIPDSAEPDNKYPYRLIVSSYNGKVVYNIDFRIVSGKVTGIELDPSRIEFSSDRLMSVN